MTTQTLPFLVKIAANLRFGSKSVAAPRFLPSSKCAFLHAPPQGGLPPRRHNFFLAPLPANRLRLMILAVMTAGTPFSGKEPRVERSVFIFRMVRRSPPKCWGTRCCRSSRSRQPRTPCRLSKPRPAHAQFANKSMISIMKPACGRWCFIPSSRRKCAM